MKNVVICPNCQSVNDVDAKVCEHCGRVFAGGEKLETIPVSDLIPPVERPLAGTEDLRFGTVALHVMGEKSPIIMDAQDSPIILGRNVFGEDAPTIDLTNYHGRLLGVSRHHAAIHMSDDTYTLEDLNSSNGTWLNDVRLFSNRPVPLHNGDMLRLGQLVLFVHFQDVNAPAEPIREPSTVSTRRLSSAQSDDRNGAIRSITIGLVGRPVKIEVSDELVKIILVHTPKVDTLPDNAPLEFRATRTYTVYIPVNMWSRVESALADRHDLLIVEGICTYDAAEGVSVFATQVTTKHIEAEKSRLLTRRQTSSERPIRRGHTHKLDK